MGSPGLRGAPHTSSSLLPLLATPPSEPSFPGSAERLMAYVESWGAVVESKHLDYDDVCHPY